MLGPDTGAFDEFMVAKIAERRGREREASCAETTTFVRGGQARPVAVCPQEERGTGASQPPTLVIAAPLGGGPSSLVVIIGPSMFLLMGIPVRSLLNSYTLLSLLYCGLTINHLCTSTQ
jgi:hypothetical protein